jgi:lactoylglutathione lyase
MRYLHTMIRVFDLEQAIEFFGLLGLVEMRRRDAPKGRFTLVFLATAPGEPELELTYNWDESEPYSAGRNFGHVAYEVDDIYALCSKLAGAGVVIHRPPRDGRMAFVRSPDGISIELLQRGAALAPSEPWISMPNVGTW